MAIDGVVFNDLCTDILGNLWVGGSRPIEDPDVPGRRSGSIYRIGCAGSATVAAEGLGIPNGMGITPDGSHLLVVDSSTRHILSAGLDTESGALGPLETWLDLSDDGPVDFGFPPAMPTPDGLAVDAAGHVWIAILGAGVVAHFDDHAQHVDDIVVPDQLVTSVAFGGEDLRDLYITTARGENGAGGSLYTTRASTPGLPQMPTSI